MSLYEGLLALHILSAVVWVGGGTAMQVMGTRIRASGDGTAMAVFGHQAEWMGMKVFMPASIVQLVTGIWLVIEIDYSFSEFWIAFGLFGILFSAVVGAAFLGPQSGKLGTLAAEKGFEDPETQAVLQRLVLVSRIELGILLLVVIDMAIKPFS